MKLACPLVHISEKNNTDKIELGDNLVISSGISMGKIGKFPEVTKQCAEISKKFGARGPINIQCRLVDGIVSVFEINPRFSGTTSLRALVGYNEPEFFIKKYLLGINFSPDFPFREAFISRNLVENINYIEK